MTYTLEKLAKNCHDELAKDPVVGRVAMCRHLEEALKDPAFVKANAGPDQTSPRHLLYEDPEFKFCILTHYYPAGKHVGPHDHGPTWAIYGQAEGTTTMTVWRVEEKDEAKNTGKASPVKTYDMTPGVTRFYDVGVVHSPRRDVETRVIRIEGINQDTFTRIDYEPVDNAVA
ncbi:MAG: hypothetical protein ACO3MW_07585 [Rhodospirillales bacterium]